METKREIYIAHEYGDKTHFKALYDCASEYGFHVNEQMILRKRKIFKKCVKSIIKKRDFSSILIMIHELRIHFRFRYIKGQIIVVGIAPYDQLLNKYLHVFENNECYYFTSHDVWDGSDFPKGTINNKETFEKILHDVFRGAFCVSQVSANQVSRIIRKVSVVNHAIDYDKYSKAYLRGETKRFIFLGGYTERKNIKLILQWLRDNPRDDVSIDFAGDGPQKKEIENAACLDNRIRQLGFYSKAELQKNLCLYDYLILPSKKEPFGIVLLEALSAGTPCIVSNAVGPSEIIIDGVNGYVFNLDDEYKSFSCVMNNALEMTQQSYIEMREKACEFGKQYSSNEIVKKWIGPLLTNTNIDKYDL